MQEGRAGLPDSAVKSERYERGEASMMKKQKIMLYRIIGVGETRLEVQRILRESD